MKRRGCVAYLGSVSAVDYTYIPASILVPWAYSSGGATLKSDSNKPLFTSTTHYALACCPPSSDSRSHPPRCASTRHPRRECRWKQHALRLFQQADVCSQADPLPWYRVFHSLPRRVLSTA